MPPPPRNPSELGNVVNYQGQYRAEIYLGSGKHIQGPRRGDGKKRAFEDLLAIRAAAADRAEFRDNEFFRLVMCQGQVRGNLGKSFKILKNRLIYMLPTLVYISPKTVKIDEQLSNIDQRQ